MMDRTHNTYGLFAVGAEQGVEKEGWLIDFMSGLAASPAWDGDLRNLRSLVCVAVPCLPALSLLGITSRLF